MTLKGKISLVTGGGQGIGRAIALKLAREGSHVAVVDVNLEKAREVVKELEAMGRNALALKVDVVDQKETEEMAEKVVSGLGALHILVNNAGITKDALVLRMKEDEWDMVLDVNLKGPYNCTRSAVKLMSKQRWGRIVNISSIVGLMGNAGQGNYSASKAGLIGFTKTVAREFATRGITCNAVAPGFIETRMTEALPEKVREELSRQIPMGRLGTPDDVADAVVFLASDAAAYITGHVLSVNGGMYM
jgi:3-oxoacyl-[acyl-carrier protein] reductase